MRLVTASEAREMVETGRAVLVDVREDDEVAAASVPGALHIPLGELDSRISELPRERRILVLCRSGNRSGMACERLASQWPEAASVQGGLAAWEKAGGAVVVRSRMIPIMRQVQIAAGFLILLGFFLKPAWFLVPVVGAGLIFAGVSGFCGMAKVLQRMPWNRFAAKEAKEAKEGGVSCPN